MQETKFVSTELWYGNRSEWTYTDTAYGVYTTSDTPATGHFVAGSHIPGGRFIVAHPDTLTATTAQTSQAILPDLLGTSLVKNDGTDYSDIIDGALVNGSFIFLGVSPYQGCKPKICERAQSNYQNKKNGFNENVIPDQLIGPQPKPIGYGWEDAIDNYWEFRSTVSAINNDRITVYAESDMNMGDPVLVRVQVSDPGAAIDQLIGGVTAVADGANTQDPSTQFGNIRVTKPAKAGSAVEIQLV